MLSFNDTEVSLFVAFISGILTFFASCLLPLVPTYLAYLSGVSLCDHSLTHAKKKNHQKYKVLRVAVFFVLGFVLTFVVLGALMYQFASLIAPYRLLMTQVGGVLFILMGLFLLGFFQQTVLSKEYRFSIDKFFFKNIYLNSFITGIIFSLGWTPCIGPVLATILFWSAQQASFVIGITMLLVYGLGLGLPFLLVAGFFESIMPWLKKSQKTALLITKVAAVIVIIAGIGMLTNSAHTYSVWLSKLLGLGKYAR